MHVQYTDVRAIRTQIFPYRCTEVSCDAQRKWWSDRETVDKENVLSQAALSEITYSSVCFILLNKKMQKLLSKLECSQNIKTFVLSFYAGVYMYLKLGGGTAA